MDREILEAVVVVEVEVAVEVCPNQRSLNNS